MQVLSRLWLEIYDGSAQSLAIRGVGASFIAGNTLVAREPRTDKETIDETNNLVDVSIIHVTHSATKNDAASFHSAVGSPSPRIHVPTTDASCRGAGKTRTRHCGGNIADVSMFPKC